MATLNRAETASLRETQGALNTLRNRSKTMTPEEKAVLKRAEDSISYVVIMKGHYDK